MEIKRINKGISVKHPENLLRMLQSNRVVFSILFYFKENKDQVIFATF